MSKKMIQARTQKFVCAAGLVKNRFVTITKSTDTVAYTAAGAKPDGVTVGDASNLVIEVMLLATMYESFYFDSVGTIADGGAIQVGASGQGTPHTNGAIAGYAKDDGVSGDIMVGYNYDPLLGAVGTTGVGTTAVEEGSGSFHKTTLTIAGVLPAIAGGANLAVGLLVYTFPAGVIVVHHTYMSMALDELDGNITADTPDVGIGTVIGAGAVATLDGTATFEDLLTGQTFADCNGTADVMCLGPTAAVPFVILTAAAHTVHFNAADGWAASGEAACPVAGTITIIWEQIA